MVMRILAPRYYLISLVLLYVLHLLMDYYLIFKTATLKVKLPVGFPEKQMAQF